MNSTKLPASAAFSDYRISVQKALSIEPRYLLERYLGRAIRPEDIHNINAVLSGVGEVREVTCAEALLLDYQIRRNAEMLLAPTEFFAYFLSHRGKIRIYLLTNDSEGVSGMGGLMNEISRSITEGWNVVENLHNHSFFLENLHTDKPQGVLAPSGSDMRVFNGQSEDLGPMTASVTNGFHTISIESSLFPLFKAVE